MHPPGLTIGQLLLIIAAFGVGFASLNGNHIWFMGLSVMTIVGLLGAAIGAGPDTNKQNFNGHTKETALSHK